MYGSQKHLAKRLECRDENQFHSLPTEADRHSYYMDNQTTASMLKGPGEMFKFCSIFGHRFCQSLRIPLSSSFKLDTYTKECTFFSWETKPVRAEHTIIFSRELSSSPIPLLFLEYDQKTLAFKNRTNQHCACHPSTPSSRV